MNEIEHCVHGIERFFCSSCTPTIEDWKREAEALRAENERLKEDIQGRHTTEMAALERAEAAESNIREVQGANLSLMRTILLVSCAFRGRTHELLPALQAWGYE